MHHAQNKALAANQIAWILCLTKDQSVSPRALSKAKVWKCFISDRDFVKIQLSVLDLVSDAKMYEKAYNTSELQMFPRGENLPRPSSICPKSHCGPATGCECTAKIRKTFHLENYFSQWGYASKHHKVLSTWQKTCRATSRKSFSIKWDTRFQHLSTLPVRNIVIPPKPSTSLGMGNC